MPSLKGAYELTSKEDVKDLYADWAETYETGFAAARGYQLPALVAEAYVSAGGADPVLDIGAGTGLVGDRLAQVGVTQIDGVDLSRDMLDMAKAKGAYRHVFTGDVLAGLSCPEGAYAGVVSAGTFTIGHVGPEALTEVLRVLRKGGLAVLSINTRHWRDAGFEGAMKALAPALTDVSSEEVPIYHGRFDHANAGDQAYLMRFRRA